MKIVTDNSGRSYLTPFLLVVTLFFLWGFAHSILDVLNKHFQDVLVISKARSGLVQAMVYGGYFLMALPAGMVISRWGYKAGIVLGLALYGIGALMFVPGAGMMSFPFFLLCLFIIGCGLTCLETSANPYVTVLGAPEGAARRINLAQSLNGLGWIVGPAVGGLMVFGEGGNVALPYAVIGGVVIALCPVFMRVRLPEIEAASPSGSEGREGSLRPLLANAPFMAGVCTLLLYVAAQTGINSFFINYVMEATPGIDARTAALMLSLGGMGLFFLGRLAGAGVMKYVRPAMAVGVCAIGATCCMIAVCAGLGAVSVACLCLTYLFESIMFPTIFSMALAKAGAAHTKMASSLLIMSIVGGAAAPVIMGLIGEESMATGFLLPLACFAVIAVYSYCYKTKSAPAEEAAAI